MSRHPHSGVNWHTDVFSGGFAEDGPVETPALFAVFSLEVRADQFPLTDTRGGRIGVPLEGPIGPAPAGEVLFHPGPVVVVVGDDAQLRAGRQYAQALGEELVLDHAPAVVACFGPRVGEIEVDDLHGMIGHAPADKLAGIGAEHADIGYRGAPDAVGGVHVELAGVLDAEEVGMGLGGGTLNEERPFARADLDLERARWVREP